MSPNKELGYFPVAPLVLVSPIVKNIQKGIDSNVDFASARRICLVILILLWHQALINLAEGYTAFLSIC